jgi:hypothetical protein
MRPGSIQGLDSGHDPARVWRRQGDELIMVNHPHRPCLTAISQGRWAWFRVLHSLASFAPEFGMGPAVVYDGRRPTRNQEPDA